MILEVAILYIKPGQGPAFEQAFAKAQLIISSMQGYVSHQLQRCLEAEDKYLLLVNWQRLEDHTVGFRQSPQYEEWRQLLHHFYEPFPVVEHFEIVHDSWRCMAYNYSADPDSRNEITVPVFPTQER